MVPAGGAKGCFTVSLRRKAGSADDAPDIALRVYAACRGARVLAATLTLAEALDEHRVPFNTSLKIDGKPSPQFWGNTLLLGISSPAINATDTSSVTNRQRPAAPTRPGYISPRMTRICISSSRPSAMGRAGIPRHANQDLHRFRAGTGGPPCWQSNDLTLKLTSMPAVAGAKCVRCPLVGAGGCNAVIYQVRIPRSRSELSGTAST